MSDLLSIVAAIAVTVGPFVAFALLAARFGADSRPTIGDDRFHATSSWI